MGSLLLHSKMADIDARRRRGNTGEQAESRSRGALATLASGGGTARPARLLAGVRSQLTIHDESPRGFA